MLFILMALDPPRAMYQLYYYLISILEINFVKTTFIHEFQAELKTKKFIANFEVGFKLS